MFRVPREFLWAIIIALGVICASIWHSNYFLGPSSVAREGTAPGTSETTVFGIKPGEWLLGIVTFMLWYATYRLVSDGRTASARQFELTRQANETGLIAANAAKDAAIAAKKSADVAESTLVDGERAYVTGGPGLRRSHTETSGQTYQTHIVFSGMRRRRNSCWNWLEAISSGLKLSDHAARSIV